MAATLRFNERKATQAAACLLKLRGGRMSYMKLIKLLYLADRKALTRWGRPITTDRFVSMNRGPVLSRVLDLATDGDDPSGQSIWGSFISEPANYEVSLKGDPSDDELSVAEVGVLEGVFKEFGHLSRWDLVELTHRLPEWKNPNGSAIPISISDILKAEGKSPLEISSVEDELNELAEADLLFTGR